MEESSTVQDASALVDPEQQSRDWAVKLFQRSPIKQEKYKQLTLSIGEPRKRVCLDIGSDNGVISLLLRERGKAAGEIWHSADLIQQTVESIRSLVGDRVDQISGQETPYSDGQFDLVVIVDFLEHIETDRAFVNELCRIVKPGGQLISNVPNPRRGPLRSLKNLLGQTDEEHGHVRPGYSREDLEILLGKEFEISESRSYSRPFSVLIDTAITAALNILKKDTKSKKGNVVTGADLNKLKKSFRLFNAVYPFVKLFVLLDVLVPWTHGHMLIASATRCADAKKTEKADPTHLAEEVLE